MKRGQFFIASVVLIALTISVTVLNLYIPKEISISQSKINDESINNALFVKDVLSGVINYFKQNWLMPYTHRTVISVENDFSLKDHSVTVTINLPNNAYNNSLILTDEQGLSVPFSVKWSDLATKNGLLFFQANAESLDYNKYYLYYNTSPSSIKKTEKKKLVNYNEDSNYITVRTVSYYARIDKTKGGRIEVFNNSGSQDNLIYFDNILTCSSTEHPLSSAINQQVEVKECSSGVIVVFTGSRLAFNETYEVTEVFLPDRIIVIDEVNFAQESVCTWGSKLAVDKNSLDNYLDSEGNVEEPAPVRSTTLIDYGEWFELYGGEYGIALAASNTSPIYGSSSVSENRAELRSSTSETAMLGSYVYNTTIIPLVRDRVNETKQYHEPVTRVTNEVMSQEINKLFNLFNQYFYDINAVVSHEETVGIFYESSPGLQDWYARSLRTPLYTSGFGVIESELILSKGANPNSIILYDNGPKPYQVSTDNYHSQSGFGLLNSTHFNNSLLLFNPDGKDFNITVTKQDSHYLTMDIYYPNTSLLNSYDFNTSPYNLELIGGNQSGFYNLTFNGTSTYSVNTTLPKTVAGTPVILEKSPVYLLYNGDFIDFYLTTTPTGSQTFTLYDPWNKSIASLTQSVPGIYQMNASVVPCSGKCLYRLEVDDLTTFEINSTTVRYIGEEQEFMINPDYPKVVLVSVGGPDDKLIYYNTSPSSLKQAKYSDLNYSEPGLQVNNSKISFDFDDLDFIYKGREWFGSRGWITCTDSCVNSFSDYKFLEKGSERVVVWANTSLGIDYYFHFYPNLSYFKVITNDQDFEFGPGWRVNDTDDTHYSYWGSSDLILGDTNKYILKHELLGPLNYVTKRDELVSASVIFPTNSLEANNSIKVNDTSIIIKSFAPGEYGFLINEDPSHYLTQSFSNQHTMKINYTYDSSNIFLSGELIN